MAAAERVPSWLDTAGPVAPPRSNGELVFAAPWESRVFGIALSLCEAGVFEWDEFRALLIAEIAAWEQARTGDSGEPHWSYYSCWQTALERVLAHKGLCETDELDRRVGALAIRPAGHDHRRH